MNIHRLTWKSPCFPVTNDILMSAFSLREALLKVMCVDIAHN